MRTLKVLRESESNKWKSSSPCFRIRNRKLSFTIRRCRKVFSTSLKTISLLANCTLEIISLWKLTHRISGSKYFSRWIRKIIRVLRVNLRSRLIIKLVLKSLKLCYKNSVSRYGIGFAEKIKIKISWSIKMMGSLDCRIIDELSLQELPKGCLFLWVLTSTDSRKKAVSLWHKLLKWCKWKEWAKREMTSFLAKLNSVYSKTS